MNPQEIADAAGVHLNTALKLLRDGTIPATKVGRQWRANSADVDAYLGRTVAAYGSRDAIDAAAAYDRMLRAVHHAAQFGDAIEPPAPLVVASDREVAAQRLAAFVFQALDPARGTDLADWRAWRAEHDPNGDMPWLDLIVRNDNREAVGLTEFAPEALERMQRWQATQYRPAGKRRTASTHVEVTAYATKSGAEVRIDGPSGSGKSELVRQLRKLWGDAVTDHYRNRNGGECLRLTTVDVQPNIFDVAENNGLLNA
ncbi:excisionase family DNA-binding protein [Tsukamurella paurometabola]|nr:excisionase family DNA-binding protein [Tsukamurella paurometabola]